MSAQPHPPKSYAVTAVDLHGDRAAVLDVWRTYMASPPEGKYEWFYVRHPVEPPTLLMLTHGPQAQPVGVAGLGTRRVCVQGEEATAGILADLVVLPEHRSLYPAMLLQKEMQRVALSLHNIVYGLPNANSTPIVRRLGYTKVGEVLRYSKVLHYGSYLERRLPRWLSRLAGAVLDRVMPFYYRPYKVLWAQPWQHAWVRHFDERFDAMWQRAQGFNGVIGVRDAQFLSWRFLSQPGQQYRIFTVASPGAGDITAYAVCKAEGATLHVVDFLADPQQTDALRLLIHGLAREARVMGYTSLSLEFMGSRQLQGVLTGCGLLERERRALYACFGVQDAERLLKLDWYVTSADEDQ